MARDYGLYVARSIEVESLNTVNSTWFSNVSNQVWEDQATATNVFNVCLKETIDRFSAIFSPSGYNMTDEEQYVIWLEGDKAVGQLLLEIDKLRKSAQQLTSSTPEEVSVSYELAGTRVIAVSMVTTASHAILLLDKMETIAKKLQSYIPESIREKDKEEV